MFSQSIRFLKLKTCYLAFALALAYCTQASSPQSSADQDEWSDWQVTISPVFVPHYLDYPGSLMHGIVKVNIAYAQPDNGASKPYEDLLYTATKPIGCKRFQHLGITPGTAGIIRIVNVGANQSNAVTNAALRMCLDLYVAKCMTRYIMVPHESFNSIVGAFRQQGFRAPMAVPGRQAEEHGAISIEIVSDNNVDSQRLVMI
jgi:hypothetical protein